MPGWHCSFSHRIPIFYLFILLFAMLTKTYYPVCETVCLAFNFGHTRSQCIQFDDNISQPTTMTTTISDRDTTQNASKLCSLYVDWKIALHRVARCVTWTVIARAISKSSSFLLTLSCYCCNVAVLSISWYYTRSRLWILMTFVQCTSANCK